jgi:cell wall-associated NlpC family hydrolase
MRTLYQQFATLSEAFHEAETTLGKRKVEAAKAKQRALAAAGAAAGYRERIRQLVTSQSRSDPFGTFGAMLSSDSPGEFAAQASIIDAVSSRRAAVLAQAARASAAAEKAESQAKTAAAAADRLTRELRAQRSDLKRRADQAAALFRRLSMAERQALSEAQTPAAAQDRARRAEPPAQTTPPANVPVSGRAGVAVSTARQQVGKPYVWGATGPGSFDCSGLTSYAWRAAGVEIPRTSRQQYAAGVKVSRSALQPGDLVYFGSPIYHVAIYVGNNTMISAPQPGDVVKYQSVDAFGDYAGATRPG